MKKVNFRKARTVFITALSLGVFLFAACDMNMDTKAENQILGRNVASTATVAADDLLGTSSTFAVIGYAGVTNAGESYIVGDLGAGPSSNSATGWDLEQNTIVGTGVTAGLGIVTGTIYSGGDVELAAYNDAVIAYEYLVAQEADETLGLIYQLDGVTFTPGVYNFPTSANLQANGILTLDFEGNSDALFIFQVGSTLVTEPNSKVVAINTGSTDARTSILACVNPGDDDPVDPVDPVDPGDVSCLGANVYWAVGTAATLDGAEFIGTVIAKTTITMTSALNDSGENVVSGRIFALGASVTMVNSKISICGEGDGGGTTPPPVIDPDPDCDFVTGGGWINANVWNHKGHKRSKNTRATFGVSGGIRNDKYWGKLSFNDHNGKDSVKIKSKRVTAYIEIDEVTRRIEGTAKLGHGKKAKNVTFIVIVSDNGEPGRNRDTFSLELSNGYTASGTLKGGNIQLHEECKSGRKHKHNKDRYNDKYEKEGHKNSDKD